MPLLHRMLPTAAITAVLLAACSADPTVGPRIDLDPEQYVLDYPEVVYDSGAQSLPQAASGGVADSVAPQVPSIFDDNTFVDPGEAPFVDVADQPTSTFGLDVDTGSFSVGRTFLAEGSLPPRESVRTEEWVNALGSLQDDPADADLGISIDAMPSLSGEGRRILRVGIAARSIAPDERPAAHLTFVVDTSGSMDIRERLGLVKASLGLLVLHLRDDDTIAIVEYSDDAAVVLEPTAVQDAQTIVDAIDRLQPSDSTNLEAGLRTGYDQAASAYADGDINAVILASDGVANVGSSDPDALAAGIAQRAADGIGLVTVGYGMGNYNDDLMEQLADQGDGFYSYLDTYAQAENLFVDRLTSTLAVVAGDAKAQVELDPALADDYRLIGYENRALAAEDFDDDSVDAGEIGAGHRVTALYEVGLPDVGQTPRSDATVATASVRWRSVADDEVETVTVPVTYGDLTGDATDAPPDLVLQCATAAFAEWLGGNRGADAPTLGEITALASAAAADLPDDGMPGSAVTPAEMVDLMELAADASQ